MLTEQAHVIVDQLSKVLKFTRGTIILCCVIVATVALLRDGLRTKDWRSAYPHYRADIGRGILLGLELLIGADIIATITAPLTFDSVGLLAAVVGIRTFLSVLLEMEIAKKPTLSVMPTMISAVWPWNVHLLSNRLFETRGIETGQVRCILTPAQGRSTYAGTGTLRHTW